MRIYSSNIPTMQLTAQLDSGTGPSATTISLDYGGFPTIVLGTDTLTFVVDPDTIKEEIVTVTAHSSGALTATITRASESTSNVTHTVGATVKHMVTARDLQEPHKHINAANYSANGSALVHGIGSGEGDVVGTDKSQTLKNKTLSTGCVVPQTYVSGLSTSLAAKASISDPTFLGNVTLPSTTTIGAISPAEIANLEGLTQPISMTFGGFETRIDTLEASSIVYAADIAAIETDIANLPQLQTGSTPVTVTSGTGTANVTSATTISGTSIVVATPASSQYAVGISVVGTNTFTIGVRTVDGTTPSGTVTVRWMVM